MDKLYLLPIERIIDERGDERGPKHIKWRDDRTGLDGYRWSMMDYGFALSGLVLIKDISQVDHDALILNADVYSWPDLDLLDVSIDPQDDLDTFFEDIGVPTDWLTPANTYLEFLRQLAAMFQFNKRYGGISLTYPITTNQGIVTFSILSPGLSDDGQDLTPWSNAIFAEYAIHIEKFDSVASRTVKLFAFLGDMSGDVILFFRDKELTSPVFGTDIHTFVSYKIVSATVQDLVDNVGGLNVRYNTWDDQTRNWFDATLVDLGYPDVVGNPQLRQLMKSAGDAWGSRPFVLAGYEF